ncbi:MAG: 30S ribosomal protein S17 [Dehalococcoidales bacterium]
METKLKSKVGRVSSSKMDKTVVVVVKTTKRHPLYRKTIRGEVKYKAHDEKNECREGDTVRIIETRPLSREKRWRVGEILTHEDIAEIQPQDIN